MAHGNGASESELRQEIARYSRWLYRLGFMPGTSGNLSVRLDEDRLLVTPTKTSKRLLRPADVLLVDLQGRSLAAGSRRVTSEIGMHLAIYQHRIQTGAVIHSHPPVATAFACAGWALDEVLCQEAVMTVGQVPLAKYATTGTEEVAASLKPYLQKHEAILLANHGAVSFGKTLFDAFVSMETLEHLAQIRLTTHQLGLLRPLRQDQVDQLLAAKARYQGN